MRRGCGEYTSGPEDWIAFGRKRLAPKAGTLGHHHPTTRKNRARVGGPVIRSSGHQVIGKQKAKHKVKCARASRNEMPNDDRAQIFLAIQELWVIVRHSPWRDPA